MERLFTSGTFPGETDLEGAQGMPNHAPSDRPVASCTDRLGPQARSDPAYRAPGAARLGRGRAPYGRKAPLSMRAGLTLLILAAGVAISAAVWVFSDGRFAFFFLPLVLAAPFVWRRRT